MELVPARNKLVFSGEPIYNICSHDLKTFLFSISHMFLPDVEFTIQVTNTCDIGVMIKSVNQYKIDDLINNKQVCVLIYNNIVHKDSMLYEFINNSIIYRNFMTFHQNDDSIREQIHNLFTAISAPKLLCIGGECYIFPKLFKDVKLIDIYSDFIEICDIAKLNNTNASCNHINYNTAELYYNDYDVCVINTGKAGCGLNLCMNLATIKPKDIYIISCNKKSFDNDLRILKQCYRIDLAFNFANKLYGIQVYKLKLVQ